MLSLVMSLWLIWATHGIQPVTACVNGVGAGCGPAEQPIIVILD